MKNNKQRKIGIDARFYGPVGKGLGRYTKEIVDNILKMDTNNYYVIFLSPQNYNLFNCTNKNVKKVLVKSRWYSWQEQIIFPWQIYKEKLDLLHFTHFNVPIFVKTKFIVTIHDLILTKFATKKASKLNPWYYRLKYFAYKLVISRAIKRAKKVIAVSEFTKKDIEKKFKAKSEKIAVIYEGVIDFSGFNLEKEDVQFSDKKLLSSYNIDDKRYLLYVGNAYPHKNLEGLLEVFKKINKDFPSLLLVLVGKKDYFYKKIINYNKDIGLDFSKVIFTGYISDKDLQILYKKALTYVFPSFYEGFGLPPLEAISQGCPVLSSNQASLPEILQDAALYFNPYNSIDFYEKMKKIIKNKHLRQELINKGEDVVKQYNWYSSAHDTYKLYLEELKR